MKVAIAAFAVLMLVSPWLAAPSRAQEYLEGGTVIAIAYSKQRIVIAADSMASFRKDGFQDEVCKVSSPARNVLFAASGIAGAGTWHAADIAREAATRIVGNNPYLSESMLISIAQGFARGMAEKLRELPPEAVMKQRRESQTSAIFAGLDRANEINLVRVTIEPVPLGRTLEVRTNVRSVDADKTGTHFLVMGRPAIAMEFLEGKTERAKAEIAQWRNYFANTKDLEEDVAIRLIELSSFFEDRKDLVGGATAAIRMDGRGGVRWLRKPPACLL